MQYHFNVFKVRGYKRNFLPACICMYDVLFLLIHTWFVWLPFIKPLLDFVYGTIYSHWYTFIKLVAIWLSDSSAIDTLYIINFMWLFTLPLNFLSLFETCLFPILSTTVQFKSNSNFDDSRITQNHYPNIPALISN